MRLTTRFPISRIPSLVMQRFWDPLESPCRRKQKVEKKVEYDGWTTTSIQMQIVGFMSSIRELSRFIRRELVSRKSFLRVFMRILLISYSPQLLPTTNLIKWLPGECNDDYRERLNLSSDVNTGVPKYSDIYRSEKMYELPHIKGGITDRQDCLLNSYQETKANPIWTIPGGGRRSGPANSGTDYDTLSAIDNMYNFNTAAASHLYQILCHFDQNLFSEQSKCNIFFIQIPPAHKLHFFENLWM